MCGNKEVETNEQREKKREEREVREEGRKRQKIAEEKRENFVTRRQIDGVLGVCASWNGLSGSKS